VPGLITCSALKRSYRDKLAGDNVVFVHLVGSKDIIGQRLNARMDQHQPTAEGAWPQERGGSLKEQGARANTTTACRARSPCSTSARRAYPRFAPPCGS